MFPFDTAALPQLTTRKALIAVDLQNDFVGTDGDAALPVNEPEGFFARAVALSEAFRAAGDVVWVQSHFDEPRPVDSEPGILVSDRPSLSSSSSSSRRPGRRSRPKPPEEPGQDHGPEDAPASPPDPEAFLSGEMSTCVRPESPGAELAPVVRAAVRPGDTVLTKTHYSAFQGTPLLRVLRAHMVMELFICGSLTNVGVYATALDAACHGMAITLIEDCCGYRSDARQARAVRSLVELTGCDVATSEELLHVMQPKEKDSKPPVSPSRAKAEEDKPPLSPDLVKPMTGLSLVSASPENGADEQDAGKLTPSASSSSSPSSPAAVLHSNENDDTGRSAADLEAERIAPSRPTASSSSPEPSPTDDGTPLPLCEGDTHVIANVLPPSLEHDIFPRLRSEIQWQPMSHQGSPVPRLVAVQGTVSTDGSVPVYRHPADESPPLRPFSTAVLAIKDQVERHVGHPVNHALIQLYRDGSDHISEHSDKTLDIVSGSYIANLSLGAQRTMVLRTKRVAGDSRRVQRAVLPHNSLCRMGLSTNMKWLHAIRQDRRADRDKASAELAFGGARISLTFRSIGTFLDPDRGLIWGQGATAKTRDDARPVVNGQGPEAVAMLRAFGMENHSSVVDDWDRLYRDGFDVLHIRSAPRLFASADAIVNMRLALMLSELGVSHAKGRMAATGDDDDDNQADAAIKFIDNDAARTEVKGQVAIMLYLDACYGGGQTARREELARRFTHFQRAIRLHDLVRRHRSACRTKRSSRAPSESVEREKHSNQDPLPKSLTHELGSWNGVTESLSCPPFLAASSPSLPDFALWPVLHAVVGLYGADLVLGRWDGLRRYYDAFAARESVRELLGDGDVGS
ncbi:hypothetical protein XA68_10481 [Ophiocordyceps unilateralis]|uniref:Fe2OG dioxygenase domain-containing protein n=1 Tax=Ophiocordyceps unilateralis TaxID=268505 RepID=A0A2A9PGV5_OPHUN|nr:hypothetical protein XA68_10481 [Ophiocordyceps unilateralis]